MNGPLGDESRALVVVDEANRAYVPMADYGRLHQYAERLKATVVGIAELLDWDWWQWPGAEAGPPPAAKVPADVAPGAPGDQL